MKPVPASPSVMIAFSMPNCLGHSPRLQMPVRSRGRAFVRALHHDMPRGVAVGIGYDEGLQRISNCFAGKAR